MTIKREWLIGIDEVGRGSLAGPVMVGAVLVPADFSWTQLPGVTDSKKLSEKKREVIFTQASALQQAGKLWWAVGSEPAEVIDQIGIVGAIKKAMARALVEVTEKASGQGTTPSPRFHLGEGVVPETALVLLDGGLNAPAEFVHQKTIIKGDATEPVIGLASIVAKVTRDREMVRLHDQFPEYGLAIHKGYGTAAHCAAVRRLGLTPVHRRSFCRRITSPPVQRP